MQVLHSHKNDDELKFSYPLLRDILPLCRCLVSGQRMEIEPDCPPTDLIRSFSRAKRKIYMTATLADDSVLVTHFGADPDKLSDPIVPTSSQSMGERMILMPQELNPEITLKEIKKLLVDLAEDYNVIVIVPSKNAAKEWEDIADQTLMGSARSGDVMVRRQIHESRNRHTCHHSPAQNPRGWCIQGRRDASHD